MKIIAINGSPRKNNTVTLCKKIGDTYGKCVIKDELHEVLNKIASADGVAFVSPIYFLDISAQL